MDKTVVSPRVDIALHSDTLSRFPSNHILCFYSACLAEKHSENTNYFIVFGLTQLALESTIHRFQSEHATIKAPMWLSEKWVG